MTAWMEVAQQSIDPAAPGAGGEWSLFLVALMPDRTVALYADEGAYARGGAAHNIRLPDAGFVAAPVAAPMYNYEHAIMIGSRWFLCPDTRAESEAWLEAILTSRSEHFKTTLLH